MSPFFSIIIPVYNAAPYLRECLNSVLVQTFTDWEAICVDDGSTDGSGAILDEYAAKDKRFRVIHQKNSGTHKTRLFALEMAVGEWMTFLDADDYVVSDRYESMITTAKSDGCDMVWGDIVERHGSRYLYHPFSHALQRRLPLEGREILSVMIDGAGYEYEWHVLYGKIYHRRVISRALAVLKTRRGRFTMCEDVGWSIVMAGAATKLAFSHGSPYIYRRNDGSCTTGTDMTKERFDRVANDFLESHTFAHEALSYYTIDPIAHRRIDVWFAKYVRGWYAICPESYESTRNALLTLALGEECISEATWGMWAFEIAEKDIRNIHEVKPEGLCQLSKISRTFFYLCAKGKSIAKRIIKHCLYVLICSIMVGW